MKLHVITTCFPTRITSPLCSVSASRASSNIKICTPFKEHTENCRSHRDSRRRYLTRFSQQILQNHLVRQSVCVCVCCPAVGVDGHLCIGCVESDVGGSRTDCSGSMHVVVQRSFKFAKKKKTHRDREGSLSTCHQQLIVNCQEHNRSWEGSASLLASMALAVVWREKKDLTSTTDTTKNEICNRT